MILAKDLKAALNSVISGLYPEGYRIYGREVSEGYLKPSFFTELKLLNCMNLSKSYRFFQYGYYITYFQKESPNGRKDEVDALDKWDELRNAFDLKIHVGDRYLNIKSLSHDGVGEKRDILQISLYIDFYEEIPRIETAPIMQVLALNEKLEVN